jgi:hypothetical protein
MSENSQNDGVVEAAAELPVDPWAPDDIYEVRLVRDGRGREIMVKRQLHPDQEEPQATAAGGKVLYYGRGQGIAKDSAGRELPIAYEFPIPAKTLRDAFAMVEQANRDYQPTLQCDLQQQLRQQAMRQSMKLAVARAAPPIVGPGGSPLRPSRRGGH